MNITREKFMEIAGQLYDELARTVLITDALERDSRPLETTSGPLKIWVDGGAHGNGTEAARCYGSYQIEGQAVVHQDFPQAHTNNEAEYRALIAALKAAPQGRPVHVYSDSNLLVNQVMGYWRVKEPELASLKVAVMQIIQDRQISLFMEWVPRAEIEARLGH
jgi:ribonuclease HI